MFCAHGGTLCGLPQTVDSGGPQSDLVDDTRRHLQPAEWSGTPKPNAHGGMISSDAANSNALSVWPSLLLHARRRRFGGCDSLRAPCWSFPLPPTLLDNLLWEQHNCMHVTLVPWTNLGAGHESLDSEHMSFLCCLALTAVLSTNNMHCLRPDAPFSQSQPSISSLCFDPSRRCCRHVHRSALTEQEALIDVALKRRRLPTALYQRIPS